MKEDIILKLLEMLLNAEDKRHQVKDIVERPVVVYANNCIIFGYP